MKNPLKKKHKFKHFLMYLATYLVVAFSAFFVVVSVSSNTYSAFVPLVESLDEESSALGQVVTSLMQLRDGDMDVTVSAHSAEHDLSVSGKLKLDMTNGVSDIKFSLDALVSYDQNLTQALISYSEGYIYFSSSDYNYSLSTDSAFKGVMSVLSLMGIDLDMSGDIMESLDMTSLMSLAGEMTDEVVGNNHIISLTILNTFNVNILTDTEYNLMEVRLNRAEVGGFEISFSLVVNETNSGTEIDTSDANYVDLSPLSQTFENFVNLLNNDKFYITTTVLDHLVELKVDKTTDLKLSVNSTVKGNVVDIKYIDNSVYLDTDYVSLKLDNISRLSSLLPSVELSSINYENVVNVVNKVVPYLQKFKLTDITLKDNITEITFGEISLTLSNSEEQISGLGVKYNDLDFALNIATDVDFEIEPDGNYVNIEDLAFLLDEKDLFAGSKFNGDIKLNYNSAQVDAHYQIDLSSGFNGELTTTIAGYNLKVNVIDNQIYFDVAGLKYYTTFNDVNELIDFVLDFDFAKTMMDNIKTTHKVLPVSSGENSITLSYGDVTIIVNKTDSLNVILNKDNASLSASVNRDCNIDLIDTNAYEYVALSKEKLSEIYNKVSSLTYSFDGSVSYKDYQIDFSLDLLVKDDLLVNVQASYDKYVVNMHIENDEYFVDFNGIKVKGNISELGEVLDVVGSYVNLPKVTLSDLKIESTELKNSDGKIYVTLSVSNNIATIVIDTNNLSVNLNYNDIKASLTYKEYRKVIRLTDQEKSSYKANVLDLANIAGGILNLTTDKYIVGTLYILDYKVDFKVIHDNDVKIEFATQVMDIDITGLYKDKTLYLSLMEQCFAIDVSDVNSLIDEISHIFDISKDDFSLNDFDLQRIKKLYSLSDYLNVKFDDYDIKMYLSGGNISSIYLSSTDINARVVLKDIGHFNIDYVPSNVLTIAHPAKLIGAFYNTLKHNTISGTIDVKFNLFSELNHVLVNYGIKYENKTLKAYLSTEFRGLSVNVYIFDDTIYLDALGIKTKIKFTEFNDLFTWLNGYLSTALPTGFQVTEFNLCDLKLNFINSVQVNENNVLATVFDTVNIDAKFDDAFTQIDFVNGSTSATITCSSYDDFVLNSVVDSEYVSYLKLTEIVDNIYDLVNSKKYSITLDGSIKTDKKSYNISSLAKLDKTHENIRITTQLNNKNIDIAMQDSYFYVNYEGLKLAINQNNLKEMLVIALQALGVNVDNLSILGAISDDLRVDTSNLSQYLPSVNLDNPLSLLDFIDSLSYSENKITLSLKSELINDKLDSNIDIDILLSENKLSKIILNNLKIDDTLINLTISLNGFDGVNKITNTGSYIDISGSSDLIRAFVNTSTLNDYSIHGTVQLSGYLGSNDLTKLFGDKLKNITIDCTVKVIDSKPVVSLAITKIPVMSILGFNINKDIPSFASSNDDRAVYIYYKDDEVYIYRHETYYYGRTRTFEKKLKISMAEMLSDPLYYILQYGVGLDDSIMDEIYASIEASNRRGTPINMANVLLGYRFNGNNSHTLTINLKEIAYNDNLGNADIELLTTERTIDSKTSKYLYRMKFNMNMPITSSIRITLATENLTLNNIGSAVNMNSVLNYINGYSYPLNEQWEAENNEWIKTADKTYTVSFDSSSAHKTIESRVGAEGSELVLPVLQDYYTDEVGVKRVDYQFLGWTTSDGKVFDSITFPRGDVTLYANWQATTTYYYTLSFVTNSDVSIPSIVALPNTIINLPSDLTIKTISSEDGLTQVTYAFAGWYLDEGFNYKAEFNQMPDASITLYAKWQMVDTVTLRALQVFDGDTRLIFAYLAPHQNIELTHEKINDNTKYYLDSEFSKPYDNSFVMPDTALNLYIRNSYLVTIHSELNLSTGFATGTTTMVKWQGEVFSLTAGTNGYYDDGTLTSRTDYTFSGIKVNGVFTTSLSVVMPNTDTIIEYVWTPSTRYYDTIIFDLTWVKPDIWKNLSSTKIQQKRAPSLTQSGTTYKVTNNQVKVLQGESFNPTKFSGTARYLYAFSIFSNEYEMKILGWNKTGAVNYISDAMCRRNKSSYNSSKNLSAFTLPVKDHAETVTLYANWGV